MCIASKFRDINNSLLPGVKLIAVSKFQSSDNIMQAYQAGHRRFGESRVQELSLKQASLPSDIEWHFVGHLQRNKVKYIVPFISLIHSVDSAQLLMEINKSAAKIDRQIPCLLQIHIAGEDNKYGFSPEEIRSFLQEDSLKKMQHVQIQGLMGMASFTDKLDLVRQEFRQLKQLFDEIKSRHFSEQAKFCELSMGMTNDYHIAMQEHSTMVRIGTALFDQRKRD